MDKFYYFFSFYVIALMYGYYASFAMTWLWEEWKTCITYFGVT